MKKITILLALLMASFACLTAFAADEYTGLGMGDEPVYVNGTYRAGAGPISVYSVDIVWSDPQLVFTYQESDQRWDPEQHAYVPVGTSGWKENAVEITITNHSNVAILAIPSYEAAIGYETVSMTFTDGEGTEIASLEVATADNGLNGAAGTPQTGVIKMIPGGILPEGTSDVEIGTITVTIAAVAEAQ